MKLKKSIIVFAIVFNSLMLVDNSAQAFDFSAGLSKAGDFLSNATAELKKQIAQNKSDATSITVAPTPEALRTDNSHYTLTTKSNPGAVWIMAVIQLGQQSEQVVFRVNSLEIQKNINFKYGPGKYTVTLFQSNDESKYRSSYTSIGSAGVFEIENNDQRDMRFLLPSEEVESEDARIVDLANQITAGTSDDVAKIKAIHDYVANLVSYDYASLVDNRYQNNAMDAVSVLEHPSTVCSGYSNLTAALLRAANIRTRVISGTAKTEDGYGGHAWNEVLVNSEWKSLDVTWDDVENLRYDYFLPSSSVFEQDHRKEEIKENY